MKSLIAIAAIIAAPGVAAAQAQIGNGMGTQSAAAPANAMPGDPSNAGKTPTAQPNGSKSHGSHRHMSHTHKSSMSGSSDSMGGASPR